MCGRVIGFFFTSDENIEKILRLWPHSILAILLFGSKVRGEEDASSDVDYLIVLSAEEKISRALYSQWDQGGIDSKISPQFVHLPENMEVAGGLWFEVGLEGEFLYEKDKRVRLFVNKIKNAIAEGRLQRKWSHGQPYWVKNTGGKLSEKSQSFDRLYHARPQKRIKALETLYQEKAWADVVRESQEVVELALKALLRSCAIEAPRTHDVSGVLQEEKDKLPLSVQKNLKRYQQISKSLRRDRELAFYGSEDLTPSEFYQQEDAEKAKESAEWVVQTLVPLINK